MTSWDHGTCLCARRCALVHSDSENPKSPYTHQLQPRVLDPLHMFARRSTRHDIVFIVCTSAPAIDSMARHLLIFGISLATTVGDVARHRVDYMPLVIACCLGPFVPCIACRSPAPGLWQASKLLFDTLSVCLSCVPVF